MSRIHFRTLLIRPGSVQLYALSSANRSSLKNLTFFYQGHVVSLANYCVDVRIEKKKNKKSYKLAQAMVQTEITTHIPSQADRCGVLTIETI